ncbi:MAG: transglutaminase domain-containing protein [Planctomycetota bacterium]
MPSWSRKRIECVILAAVGLLAIAPLRIKGDEKFFVYELIAFGLTGVIASARNKRLRTAGLSIIVGAPIVFSLLASRFASPVAPELIALTQFGAVALALALGASTTRTRSMSLVVSGFLVLFCAVISDEGQAIAFPLVWMAICVWHLIANHWDRLETAMPDQVSRHPTTRPVTMGLALAVLTIGGYAVRDRFTNGGNLSFELMPTSGGTTWDHSAARKGVGSGDAAIAAKDHAESFGAVDSDIFLESTESTLFDMINDMVGEPKMKKQKWERRQAMANDNVIPMHERAAKSEKGGGSFSTERLPPPKHRHFEDAKEACVVQWDGATGIRLAMQRFDAFDGVSWIQTRDFAEPKLTRVIIGEQHWFFDPKLQSAFDRHSKSVSVGLLKVIRLKSPRLPVPMLSGAVHVKEVDRQDFFAIDRDGSFFMPERDWVPPLTVVHVASQSLLEDQLRERLSLAPKIGTNENNSLESWRSLAHEVTKAFEEPYDKLNAIANHLREEFVLDRSVTFDDGSALEGFFKSKRGGNHLFATAAAVMADELGLESRLVTGFYVRPDAFDFAAGHSNVLPTDVHFWVEVKLRDGQWFEMEPTPGYLPPTYKPSWRLLAQRMAARYWPHAAISIVSTGCLFWLRRYWINFGLTLIWLVRGLFPVQQRLRLGMWIIETRAALAGMRRPSGTTQRTWLEGLSEGDGAIADASRQFLDVADAAFFGRRNITLREDSLRVVRMLSVQTISNLLTKVTT